MGLKNSWLKSPGLKLGVEESGVEMSFNLFKNILSDEARDQDMIE